jgi:hypothetical protein
MCELRESPLNPSGVFETRQNGWITTRKGHLMQIDFHHAVTYVLARLAEFTHDESRTIAYAAQYVDDCHNAGTLTFDTGTRYCRIASAHTTYDVVHHCDMKEDCRVWVPFHFLPGNIGKASGETLNEPMMKRLVCTPDSHLATDMWAACYATKSDSNALHRLGITTHVYADTFAHCFFAGVLDSVNHVADITHEAEQFRELIDNLTSRFLELIPLGHGAALTFPDWPFLVWSYRNSDGAVRRCDNPQQFILASEQVFRRYLAYRGMPDRNLPAADRAALENAFRTYTETDGNARHSRWHKLIREGGFSFGGLSQEQADSLVYADRGPGSWKYKALGPNADRDDGTIVFHYTPEFETSDWRLFHEALKSHQKEVLDRILPTYSLSLPLTAAAAI